MNWLLWNVGAINGALAGYGSSVDGMVEPTTAMVSNKMYAALIGALTITASKLIFNWVPRIVKPLQLNMDVIVNLNDINVNTNNDYTTFGIYQYSYRGTCTCPLGTTIDGTKVSYLGKGRCTVTCAGG